MGVINDSNIPQKQFLILSDLLRSIPIGVDKMYDLVANIANSEYKNNNVHIVKGVHYMEYDTPTQFHFNIKIESRSYNDGNEHHVYVVPYSPTNKPSIIIKSDKSVYIMSSSYSRGMTTYLLHSIPSLFE